MNQVRTYIMLKVDMRKKSIDAVFYIHIVIKNVVINLKKVCFFLETNLF